MALGNGIATRILHHWWCWRSCIGAQLTVDAPSAGNVKSGNIDRIGIGPDMRIASAITVGEGVDHIAFASQWGRHSLAHGVMVLPQASDHAGGVGGVAFARTVDREAPSAGR
jgi:hypothetical protein